MHAYAGSLLEPVFFFKNRGKMAEREKLGVDGR
jgi:hypothetical protein